ncbi:MAG: hypothetical protein HYY16_16850 [Planctomycetes bacterium]|nr:hypothetical protein [Planctomycetota bacterium]
MKKALVLGSIILCAFVAYAAWMVFFGGRIPLLSYDLYVKNTVVRFAEETIEKQKPPRTNPEELRKAAEALRRLHHELIERASDSDKRRPSYRKTDDVVTQIEYAAQNPDSADVVGARFGNAMELIQEVKSMVGTPRDEPQ